VAVIGLVTLVTLMEAELDQVDEFGCKANPYGSDLNQIR
jgi:hypothetical protein